MLQACWLANAVRYSVKCSGVCKALLSLSNILVQKLKKKLICQWYGQNFTHKKYCIAPALWNMRSDGTVLFLPQLKTGCKFSCSHTCTVRSKGRDDRNNIGKMRTANFLRDPTHCILKRKKYILKILKLTN